MANHKSSKKRTLTSEKKRIKNISRKTVTKTIVKKATKAISSGTRAEALATVKLAESKLMKAAGKVMPKKRASRKVSRLARAASIKK